LQKVFFKDARTTLSNSGLTAPAVASAFTGKTCYPAAIHEWAKVSLMPTSNGRYATYGSNRILDQ
jgi:hypothetical protein